VQLTRSTPFELVGLEEVAWAGGRFAKVTNSFEGWSWEPCSGEAASGTRVDTPPVVFLAVSFPPAFFAVVLEATALGMVYKCVRRNVEERGMGGWETGDGERLGAGSGVRLD
jgi:hypothetical protein